MRISELLLEASSYTKELEAFVLDLLVAFRAIEITELDFDDLLMDIRANNFDVDADWLKGFLEQQDIVDNLDMDKATVTLSIHEEPTMPDEEEEEEETDTSAEEEPEGEEEGEEAEKKISDMASSAAKSAVKS